MLGPKSRLLRIILWIVEIPCSMFLIALHFTFFDSLISILYFVLSLHFAFYILCFFNSTICPLLLGKPNFLAIVVILLLPVSRAFIAFWIVNIPSPMALVTLHHTFLDHSWSMRINSWTLSCTVEISKFISLTIHSFDYRVTMPLILYGFKFFCVSMGKKFLTLTIVLAFLKTTLYDVATWKYFSALTNH